MDPLLVCLPGAEADKSSDSKKAETSDENKKAEKNDASR